MDRKNTTKFADLQILAYLCSICNFLWRLCIMIKERYSRLLFVFVYVLFSLCANAVAPLPGLNITEPQRTHIQSDINKQVKVLRQRQKRRTPSINMAPRGLLILAQFADRSFSAENDRVAFDSLANALNYTYNGATGSCSQYFADQSNGQYIPKWDVVGPVTLPNNIAYYGTDWTSTGDDRYIADFVIDACTAVAALGVDFSQYDNDGDGMIDFVYILYAGFGQADGGASSTIWPHNWDIESALACGNTHQTEFFCNYDFATDRVISENIPYFNGKRLHTYACSNELVYRTQKRSGIGTICHEFGHVLGLPDYYVVYKDSPMYGAGIDPGSWSIMGNGNYLNNGNTPPNYSVYDKFFLGWLAPEVLSKDGQYVLSTEYNSAYMLTRDQTIPDKGAYCSDTIYYIENRQQKGWDRYLAGHGMLVWQVVFDEDEWRDNTPNDYSSRYRLISASGRTPYTDGALRQDVPFPGAYNVQSFMPFASLSASSEQQEPLVLANIEEKEGQVMFSIGDVLTELVNNNSEREGTCYNILGIQVSPDYKGVVIQNGQKRIRQ